MIRTRCSASTVNPNASHIRRIWRFRPWVRVIRNTLAPSLATLHGLVVASDSRTPAAMLFKKSGVIARSTATTYSFSWLCSARRTSLTMSPSLVSRIRPSESLSSRPIGNTRSG